MKNFFKIMFASMFGVILASFLLIFIIAGIVSLAASSEAENVQIEENTVLVIDLEKAVGERTVDDPMANLPIPGMGKTGSIGLNDILKNIDKAKTDKNIVGIYMKLNTVNAGMSSIEEIRNALIEFKKESPDKFIISYSDSYSQKSYYLASVSDSIFLNPQGEMPILGLRAEVMFMKSALDKLGIEAQVIRHGKFKSAVEPFMQDTMSENNRLQMNKLLTSIWDSYRNDISEIRNINIDSINAMANGVQVRSANDALAYNLVDGLRYKDQMIALMKQLTSTKEDEDVKTVSIEDYTNVPLSRSDEEREKGRPKDKIAVIYANGEINMGEGDEATIGSENISRAIREAREDEDVKAIVLRVNSPGGSALASDIIWREVTLAKAVKPVVVSMGDYAASGGYYIACAADYIVADEMTLTGSIGVFGVLFNGKQLLNEKLGIYTEVVKTNNHSDMGSFSRALTSEEQQIIQGEVERVYDTFIGVVAEGRGMTKAEVDSIGQGRVWSGIDAIEIGLVDEIGGLERAIEIAAERAKLENYRLLPLPEIKDPFDQILEQISGSTQSNVLENTLGVNYKYFEYLETIAKMNGVQTRLPFFVEIQ